MTELAICSCCGKQHPISEIELSFRRPDAFLRVPPEDRESRTRATDDLCAIWGADDTSHRYFVRGLLPFKVKEWDTAYSLGVWLEVSKQAFDRIFELWDDVHQSSEPPFSAKLANTVPFHHETCGLSGKLFLTGPSTRPRFQLNIAEDTLSLEQTQGISAHRAVEYAEIAASSSLQRTPSGPAEQ